MNNTKSFWCALLRRRLLLLCLLCVLYFGDHDAGIRPTIVFVRSA